MQIKTKKILQFAFYITFHFHFITLDLILINRNSKSQSKQKMNGLKLKNNQQNFQKLQNFNNINTNKNNELQPSLSKQKQKRWLEEFHQSDLARTLIRQYLYQNNLFKTLSTFQKQQPKNKNKINKSILIKMLSLTSLVYNNKISNTPLKSILDVLVSYLKNKFSQRVNGRENANSKNTNTNGNQNMLNMNMLRIQKKVHTVDNEYKNHMEQQEDAYSEFSENKKQTQMQIQSVYQRRQGNSINLFNYQEKCEQKTRQKHGHQQLEFLQKADLSKKTFKDEQKAISTKNTHKNQRPSTAKQSTKTKKPEEQKNMKIYNKITQNNLNSKQQKNQEVQQQKIEKCIQVLLNEDKNSNMNQKKKQIIVQQIEQVVKLELKQKVQIQQNKQNHKQIQKQKVQIKQIKQINKRQQKQLDKNQQIQQALKKDEKVQKVQKQQKAQNIQQDNQVVNKIQIQKEQLAKQKPRETMRRISRNTSNKVTQKGKLSQIAEISQRQNSNISELPSCKPGQKDQIKNQKQKQAKIIIEKSQTNQNKITNTLMNDFQDLPQNGNKNDIKQLSKTIANQTEPKVFKMKKKQKKTQKLDQYQTKFKFDQNFIDKPLNTEQKYDYQPFKFEKMTINQEQAKINKIICLQTKNVSYTVKPSASANLQQGISTKKKIQTPLTQKQISSLKKIVFQNGNSNLPKAWHQGFILSQFPQTFYGLKQIQGGPCGIIAAVQCYFLKHLLYCSKPENQQDFNNQSRREISLVCAITDMLFKVRSNGKIILIIPSNKNFSGAKLDFSYLVQIVIEANDFKTAFQSIWSYRTSFIGPANHGVTTLLYSIVMTKTVQEIQKQIDCKENPLIGHHGHCTQELVNLFITGRAISNCFDGIKELQDNFKLNGITQKSQFGFLTIFQTLKYIQVGKNLKNPVFPIWIISKQFHYHVVFGNHYLIAENNNCQKFDIVYFDGLYNCSDKIRLTLNAIEKDQFGIVKQTGKISELPLIQQVLLTKWGKRTVDWNGSLKIL